MTAITRAPRRDVRTVIATIAIWVIVAVYLFPLYWMAATSFKTSSETIARPPTLFPTELDVGSYVSAVFGNGAFYASLSTSAIVSSGTVILTATLAIPAAFALSRSLTRRGEVGTFAVIMSQLLPSIVVATPLFIMFSGFGLTDTYLGLILAQATVTLPFAIIVLRPFFDGIPVALDEAAELDGAGPLRRLIAISVPLVRPGLITVAALTFILAWGDLVFGLTLTKTEQMRPITLLMSDYVTEYGTRWNDLMAVATAASASIIAVFVGLQRYIVGGMMSGAVKS